MITLANLYGSVGLHLISDDINNENKEEVDKMVTETLDFMPIGLPIDELKLSFKVGDSELKSEVKRYKRGEQLLSVKGPAGYCLSEQKIQAVFEEKTYEVQVTEVKSDVNSTEFTDMVLAYV